MIGILPMCLSFVATVRGQDGELLERPDQSITELLVKWGSGDKAALDELMPLVYDELRKLAASYLRRQSGSRALQPTALSSVLIKVRLQYAAPSPPVRKRR